MAETIKLKRGMAAAWTKRNLVLAPGEVGVELDTHQIKVGDGTTAWNDLPYVGGNTPVVNIQDYTSNPATVNGVPYQSIDVAFMQAPANSVVRLNRDFENSVSINKDLTIDLNGNNMINNSITPIEVVNNAILTIKGQGTIECNKNGEPAIFNNGKVVIENGKLQRTTDVSGNGYYTYVNHGNTVINGGMFMSGGTYSSMIESGYRNYTSTNPEDGYVEGTNNQMPTLEINGGTFAGGLYAIKNDDNGVLNITDGVFYNTILSNGASLSISGGYFENTKQSSGEYNLYLRQFDGGVNDQYTYISGGTFITAQPSNFKVEGNPTIEITGGRFNRELDPSWLASGYKQEIENGFYVVKKEETANG